MIFEKIRERLQDVIDGIEVYTVGRLNTEKANISILQLQRFANELKKINQAEAEYNNGWIKCGDEPLAVGCKYLVVDKDNDIYIATYLNNNVFIARDKNYFMPIRIEATYCQLLPLPQPPKGE